MQWEINLTIKIKIDDRVYRKSNETGW